MVPEKPVSELGSDANTPILPEVGSIKPINRSTKVLLPLPVSPINAIFSPLPIEKSTERSVS